MGKSAYPFIMFANGVENSVKAKQKFTMKFGKSLVSDEIVEKVERVLLEDQRFTIMDLAFRISETYHTTIHKTLIEK